jgi:hypothetical protein
LESHTAAQKQEQEHLETKYLKSRLPHPVPFPVNIIPLIPFLLFPYIYITESDEDNAQQNEPDLHIEDQIQTKRCRHPLGETLVSREEFLICIRATGRYSIPGGSIIVIIARMDALQSSGVYQAIER